MPTSDASAISTIIGILQRERPQRVLDVGPGYGKYGMLCREYLGPILRRVDAFEPWPQGMMPALRLMYDVVHAEPFPPLAAPPRADMYDLVMMIDVVEHYDPLAGGPAMQAALRLAPLLLVSTPHIVHAQGQVDGNPWEEHKSQWSESKLLAASGARAAENFKHDAQIITLLTR